MRPVLYILSFLAVLASAFWAYRENYATQAQLKDIAAVQDDIATLRENIALQRAEWAYLNRPDRLAELADLNFDKLNLLPLDPGQFADVAAIPYPVPAAPATTAPTDGAIVDPVDVSGVLPTQPAAVQPAAAKDATP